MRLFFLILFFFSTKAFSQQLLAQLASVYDGISGVLNADLNLYEHIDKIFIPEKIQTIQKIPKKFNKKSIQLQKNHTDLNKIIKKIETKRILLENSNNTLSEFCYDVGYLTQVSIDQYYCFNEKVSRAEFESNLKN